MDEYEMKAKELLFHPKTVVTLITMLFGAYVWMFTTFVSASDFEKHIIKFDTAVKDLKMQIEVPAAFAMERGFKEDLRRHKEQKPSPVTRTWTDEYEDLEDKLGLATGYKDCLVNEQKNCDLLQKQLYQ